MLGGLSCVEYYELIRAQVHHEDDLINHRLSWLTQSQSIFIAAYAIILMNKPEYILFRGLMILVGLTITIVISLGIRAAVNMMKRSVTSLRQACPQIATSGGELLPDLRITDRLHQHGLMPAKLLPLTFAVTWSILLVPFVFQVYAEIAHRIVR